MYDRRFCRKDIKANKFFTSLCKHKHPHFCSWRLQLLVHCLLLMHLFARALELFVLVSTRSWNFPKMSAPHHQCKAFTLTFTYLTGALIQSDLQLELKPHNDRLPLTINLTPGCFRSFVSICCKKSALSFFFWLHIKLRHKTRKTVQQMHPKHPNINLVIKCVLII